MIEKLKIRETAGPIHLIRCIGELAVMYANERYRAFSAMMDDAMDVWGDEDE